MSSETTSTTPANVSSSVLGTDLTKPASFKQRIAGRGAQFALKQAGAVLSRKEARAAAKETGRSVTEIMGAAAQKGVGLGAGLVNQFNKSPFGSTGLPFGFSGFGQSNRMTQAMQTLEPLRGLTLPKGVAYMGSAVRETPATSTRNVNGDFNLTPGRTEYLPILTSRQVLRNAQATAPTAGGYATPTQAGTAGEDAARVSTSTTTQSSSGTPNKKDNRKKAKSLAKKSIQKREARKAV